MKNDYRLIFLTRIFKFFSGGQGKFLMIFFFIDLPLFHNQARVCLRFHDQMKRDLLDISRQKCENLYQRSRAFCRNISFDYVDTFHSYAKYFDQMFGLEAFS